MGEDDGQSTETSQPHPLIVTRTRRAEVGEATAVEFERADGRALIVYSWPDVTPP